MTRIAVALLTCCFALPVWAQDVAVQVQVRAPNAAGGYDALAEKSVELHVVTPPHTLESSHTALTDAEGVARFRVPVRSGAEAYAEVDNGRRFFSDAIALDASAERTIVLDAYPVVRDPGVLFAASVQSIVELWEDYLVVSQVWTFGVDQPVVFQSTTEQMGSIVRIPMPDDAEGITVVHPADQARVMDGYVAVAADVAPAGMDDEGGPDLVVRYSVPSDNRRRVTFAQELSMDVERLSVIVPQQSQHARHLELDVRFDVPLCEGGGEAGDRVCFREVGDRAEGALIRDDVPLQVARGNARSGQILEITTVGWPHASRVDRHVALALAALVGVFGVFLWRRERGQRARSEDESVREALRVQRAQLIDAAAELEERFVAGELLERDYDVARSRIREQLAVVLRRQREIDGTTAAEDA